MLEIKHATCKNQLSPASVGDGKPSFGWRLASSRQDCSQEAYRLTVFQNGEVFWDSGKVNSRLVSDIPYEGPTLDDARAYFWKVQAWDNAGEMAESGQNAFFTGVSRWNAHWIEPEPLPQLAENPLKKAMKDWQEFYAAFLRGERERFLTDTDIQAE